MSRTTRTIRRVVYDRPITRSRSRTTTRRGTVSRTTRTIRRVVCRWGAAGPATRGKSDDRTTRGSFLCVVRRFFKFNCVSTRAHCPRSRTACVRSRGETHCQIAECYLSPSTSCTNT
ncbi:hypothetical protein C6499_02155 [Candidatus Poribacteria bacterium]|nr:MAG: hypothetical protein C6499_02155 [Candidatus Poribacteria bacterium]